MTPNSAKEELHNWDSLLDEYEHSIGLPVYHSVGLEESNLQQYLAMSRDKLEKLGPQECAEIAYILGQFSFHIQRTANREDGSEHFNESAQSLHGNHGKACNGRLFIN